ESKIIRLTDTAFDGQIVQNDVADDRHGAHQNGVDLEDDGDKWYRRIAYRFIWMLPALEI
ncbi:MAG: hypothetical protein J5626_08055, partial [Lachnospiraceae bacterium]|nr:hypothetical protein [Lachnospiraceae bacterium]